MKEGLASGMVMSDADRLMDTPGDRRLERSSASSRAREAATLCVCVCLMSMCVSGSLR
jgi:hypothetical protein